MSDAVTRYRNRPLFITSVVMVAGTVLVNPFVVYEAPLSGVRLSAGAPVRPAGLCGTRCVRRKGPGS